MRLSLVNIYFAAIFLLISFLFASCDKVDVDFGNANPSGDPDVTYYNDYQVSLQTLQVDSFLTSSQNTFTIGYHRDPVFGTIHAGSYAQVELPTNNPIVGENVSFDSLELILNPKGNYYGDTTLPINIKVYQLTQEIQNSTNLNNNNFYNTSSFGYDTTTTNLLGQQSIRVSPLNGTAVSVQLSNALGQDLLNKLQTGATEISNQIDFVNYFNGLYIDVDSNSTNSLYTFTSSGGLIMRLYYSLHGIVSVPKSIDFPYTASRQFSHIDYNRTGTNLSSSFPPFINNVSLQNSSLSGDKAYLNSSTGDYIKISFPNLLNLETLYPYIKVLSAQLVIPPSPGTFNYPYQLPPVLTLYQTDKNNALESFISVGSGPATGNLFIDNLNGQSTEYTYDVTTFINTVIGQGISSTSALILSPEGTLGDQSLTRLIVNDQNSAKGIQLKLYILGL
jgi:hypothetical protein